MVPRGARPPMTTSWTTRNPEDTLNVQQLLNVCGTATNAFVNLAQSSGLPARRLLLLNEERVSKHVVVEVLIDNRWIIVDPSYRTMLRLPDGNLVTRASFKTPKFSTPPHGPFPATRKNIPMSKPFMSALEEFPGLGHTSAQLSPISGLPGRNRSTGLCWSSANRLPCWFFPVFCCALRWGCDYFWVGIVPGGLASLAFGCAISSDVRGRFWLAAPLVDLIWNPRHNGNPAGSREHSRRRRVSRERVAANFQSKKTVSLNLPDFAA